MAELCFHKLVAFFGTHVRLLSLFWDTWYFQNFYGIALVFYFSLEILFNRKILSNVFLTVSKDPVLLVPSTYLINAAGVPTDIIPGYLPPDEFYDKVKKTVLVSTFVLLPNVIAFFHFEKIETP